jgi:hypothetical protein
MNNFFSLFPLSWLHWSFASSYFLLLLFLRCLRHRLLLFENFLLFIVNLHLVNHIRWMIIFLIIVIVILKLSSISPIPLYDSYLGRIFDSLDFFFIFLSIFFNLYHFFLFFTIKFIIIGKPHKVSLQILRNPFFVMKFEQYFKAIAIGALEPGSPNNSTFFILFDYNLGISLFFKITLFINLR